MDVREAWVSGLNLQQIDVKGVTLFSAWLASLSGEEPIEATAPCGMVESESRSERLGWNDVLFIEQRAGELAEQAAEQPCRETSAHATTDPWRE